jgi:hypothetical protein
MKRFNNLKLIKILPALKHEQKLGAFLVDLGALVGKVDVVLVRALLHQHVEEAEGGDQRTDHRVRDWKNHLQLLPITP